MNGYMVPAIAGFFALQGILGVLLICLARWLFRVNRILREIERMNDSLAQLPAVRRYLYAAGRKVA